MGRGVVIVSAEGVKKMWLMKLTNGLRCALKRISAQKILDRRATQ